MGEAYRRVVVTAGTARSRHPSHGTPRTETVFATNAAGRPDRPAIGGPLAIRDVSHDHEST